MVVKFISHLLAVSVGFVLAYIIFNQDKPQSQNPQSADTSTLSDAEYERKVEPAVTETLVIEQTNDSAELNKLRALVKSQSQEITQLKSSLVARTENESDQMVTDKQSLETISMDDFEDRLKGSFKNRFKGVAIELKQEQVNEFQKMFEANPEKSDWGVEFENQITNYISNGDPNGLHFIEEVNCNNHMCRLRVQSNESNSWESLYSSMTQENWFNSMTLVEKSEIPGMHIYYIPKPQDM